MTAPAATPAITGDDVLTAADRLAGQIVHTPLIRLPLDGDVWVKPESLQTTGSFKFRGAMNALLAQRDEALRRGVVADSSGNHGQAVAAAAARLGIRATIVIPVDAAPVKVARTAAWGPEIVRSEPGTVARLAAARELVERTGAVYVAPFDDPFVMAGQGTVGAEIAMQLPDVATVLVPVGGGGLISGIATALAATRRAVRVVGIEPAHAADTLASLDAGHRIELTAEAVAVTIADGARAQAPGTLTFPIVQALVDAVVTVDDDALRDAVRWYATEARLVIEPTGALTLAALATGAVAADGPTVVVASGGNVDGAWLARVLDRTTRR